MVLTGNITIKKADGTVLKSAVQVNANTGSELLAQLSLAVQGGIDLASDLATAKVAINS